MLGRIATNVSVRPWMLTSIGFALLIAVTLVPASAPPRCKCPPGRPTLANPCTRMPALRPHTTEMLIEREIACAERMVMYPRRSYVSLMHARILDTDGAYTDTIDTMLVHMAPLAADQYLVLEDYKNAAGAMLVSTALAQR